MAQLVSANSHLGVSSVRTDHKREHVRIFLWVCDFCASSHIGQLGRSF